MILPIRSQGFPNLIDELGVQSPIQGPFWGFESTVIPTVDVRGLRTKPRSPAVYDGFASAGTIVTPAAGAFLAQTNTILLAGAWAIQLSWAFINASAGSANIIFVRMNDTFTVTLEREVVAIIGGTVATQGLVGYGSKQIALQKNSFGQPWALRVEQALVTAGTVVEGAIRLRYLGQVEGPAGF